MKIVSWNLNGIRRFSGGRVKKVLEDFSAEVVCIQETKISRDAVTADVAMIDGYNSYFSFCYSGRKGYAGVATFCSDTCKPSQVYDHLAASGSEGRLGDVSVDGEGRAVITEYYLKNISDNEEGADSRVKLAVINLYCVNYVPENKARFEFKMNHHALVESRMDWYRERGYHVIILGDLNIAHRKVDHCEAHLMPDFDVQPHRLWLSHILAKGYVDCYRFFHPTQEKAYTVWNQQTGARATNYGTRVDYFIANQELVDLDVFADCRHLATYLGSDHCPIELELKPNWILESATELSPLCSKFMPEFRGTQKSIRNFFTSSSASGISSQSKVIAKKPRGAQQSSISSFFVKKTAPSNPAEDLMLEDMSQEAGGSSSQLGFLVEDVSSIPKRTGNFLNTKKRAVPKCEHGEPAVERVVKKKGPNINRRFYSCARPQGFAGDKNARCNYFEWA